MGNLQLIKPNARKQSTALQVAVFQSETMAVMNNIAPRRSFSVLYIVTGMIVFTILLMSVVSLDRVVTGTGEIMPVNGSLFVQPLDRAIVKEIMVRKGDIVHKGQVLARLDPTFAAADLNQASQHGVATHALVERLDAELNGRGYVPTASDSDGQLQQGIFRQRQTEYSQSVNDFESRIGSAQASLARAESNARTYRSQFAIAEHIHGMRSELEAKGFGSKLDTLIASASSADVQRQANESLHDADLARHNLAALGAQLQVYKSKWRDDIAVQLAAARNDLNTNQSLITKARKINDLIELVAPEDAVVFDIGTLSVGSVVDPISGAAKPLFTLTPLRGALEADIAIPSRDIGFVQAGQKVMIKLEAYDFLKHSTVEGRIISISEGSFKADATGNKQDPYFKARVHIDRVALTNVPKDFRLIPGMTLTGDILVGHRTIISYLISGATRASKEAMREPN